MKHKDLLGVVLCGGKALRMDGVDKGLLSFNKKPMASYGVKALSDCQEIIINANRNNDLYKSIFSLPVVSDIDNNCYGPLSGMLSALKFAKRNNINWVITVPCDAPYIDSNYVEKMYQSTKDSSFKILMANDGFMQPVFSIMHVDIIMSLEKFLLYNQRKIIVFFQIAGYSEVFFKNSSLFTNINTIKEKDIQEKLN